MINVRTKTAIVSVVTVVEETEEKNKMPEEEKVVCETCGHDCHCNSSDGSCCVITEKDGDTNNYTSCECPTCKHD